MSCPPETPGTSEPDASPATTISVLVVDDDARVLAALRAAVGSEPDLELLHAAPDDDARAGVGGAARVVALVDVPDAGEGNLLLVHLLSRRPGWRVVAMSTRNGPRQASRAAGAAAFVVKGEDVEAVLSAVRAVASSSWTDT